MRALCLCLTVSVFGTLAAIPSYVHAQDTSWPGTVSEWNGYVQHQFEHDGRKCFVVEPKEAAKGNPWVWRARFWGHEPQTDLALLEKGFHVVYRDVADLYGSPKAVAHWDEFYEYLTEEHGFDKQTVLEGMSRGGLIVLNWAIANPDRVHAIYVDAPVCDIRSWPGGKGTGKGAEANWRRCLEEYGLTEEQATAWTGGPLDQLKPLAEAKVPIISVCGDADDVVPMPENTDILAERYRKLGGPIEVISKPGIGHHPHSLKDPAPIVRFILNAMQDD